MSDLDDVELCDNRGCVARGACYRYRARPKDAQTYRTFSPGPPACDAIVPVEAWMVARGRVIRTEDADRLHLRAEQARDITPTRAKEDVK